MSENGLVKLPSAKEDVEVEMIDVFELDGDIYSMPKTVSAGLGLKFLKAQHESGPDGAIYSLMVDVLGPEAYEALMNHPTLQKEDLDKIMEIVENHALGGAEGKSGGANRRKRSKK